jgi:D-alanyl-D-alanine carboxypeptidase (penicillin-binding protein 5/6)
MVSISGTTAGLKQGDELTVLDLLYGTMLPSGNDAALGVADAVGRFLGSETNINASQALRMFLLEMNKQAKELNLVCTNFANPHGLANCEN